MCSQSDLIPSSCCGQEAGHSQPAAGPLPFCFASSSCFLLLQPLLNRCRALGCVHSPWSPAWGGIPPPQAHQPGSPGSVGVAQGRRAALGARTRWQSPRKGLGERQRGSTARFPGSSGVNSQLPSILWVFEVGQQGQCQAQRCSPSAQLCRVNERRNLQQHPRAEQPARPRAVRLSGRSWCPS